jgi:hypothetical protein
MIQSDQRRGMRYDVQLPCQVLSPFRAFGDLSGVTLNMSRNGLLLSLDRGGLNFTLPQVGHAARLLLQLPAAGAAQNRYLECLGRVVRIEDSASLRVAFEFKRFQFTALTSGTA